MDFEWDEEKRKNNIIKHRVDLSICLTFDWEGASIRIDRRRDYGEERAVAYGSAEDGHFYVIVFTVRNGRYRVISVRPFGRKDHIHYDQTKNC